MDNKTNIGALLEVPVSSLTGKYKELLASLTVANPEYKSARFFGKGYIDKKIPPKLTFFITDKNTKKIHIPRGVSEEYLRAGTEIFYTLSSGRKIPQGDDGTFSLRPKQQVYFDDIVLPYIDTLETPNIDILLNAQCGSGKTIMALYLANLYKRNTLVCVTKKNIGEGFIKTVKKFFPNWTCGWVDGKNTYDITLGTYALLSQDNYTTSFFKSYGHIVLDEFHRCGAETYSKILQKAPCKYRTSLTATFRRKDGLHKILKLHAGKILEMERDEQVATIYPLNTGVSINEEMFRSVGRFATKFENLEPYSEVAVKDPTTKKEVDRGMVSDIVVSSGSLTLVSSVTGKNVEYTNEHKYYNLGIASAPMIDTEISEMDERNDMIISVVRECYKLGRSVILLSKRKEQLFKLEKILTRYGIPNGVFVSDKDAEYKKYCESKGRTTKENEDYVFYQTRVILGIDKLAEEGMDVPKFDTMIYLHPVKDIEQSIGRILRENPEGNCPPKKHPIAFFLLDKVNSYTNSYNSKKDGAKKMFLDLGHIVEPEKTITELKQLFSDGKI
jgi:superfamily II DNA or RNA helicase